MLKALQAEAAEVAAPPRRARTQLAAPEQAPLEALPNKPEARSNPCETVSTAEDEAAAARGTPRAARTPEPATGDRASEHRSEAPDGSNPTRSGILA
jgi:hypothetical protein